jgi:very-short-patch-repair endonuclease
MANDFARQLRKNMTPQEVKLWCALRDMRKQHGAKFRRQVPLRGYIVDFACFDARLIIELDGSQHGSADGLARDAARDETLRRGGFSILRFWNAEVDENLDGVWRAIEDAIVTARHTTESPPTLSVRLRRAAPAH